MSVPENGNGKPSIGLYICYCGFNIASKVDVEEVARYASGLPSVKIARAYKYMCSDPGQEMIINDINTLKLNRIIVASCSPLLHEQTFRKVLEKAGLNPYLFHMINLREHVSWVTEDRKEATEKAKALVRAGVYRIMFQQPLPKRTTKIDERVLIIGGGIAGITAALEIANAGKQVFLVEKEPTIGGHMAKFDKTFPTLDCASCILTPKMSSVASHPNIHLLTLSEVENVKGYVGNFEVTVLKKSRKVNEDVCTGCGECEKVCPVEIPSEFDEYLGMRKAIYKPFAQAVPNVYNIHKEDMAPCVHTCPAGINAYAYIALARQKKYEEAFQLILERTPLVATLGRACYAPCEEECSRSLLEGPVRVRRIKRFIADWYYKKYPEPRIKPPDKKLKKKVAVVGSGPSSLTCAFHLARKGYSVTIFEKEKQIGGVLRFGIPDYRLPGHVLDRDIKNVTALGVEIQTNSEVRSLDALFEKGYNAIFVGGGAIHPRMMGIKGEKLKNVYSGLEFLRQFHFGNKMDLHGKDVLVVGGGNVAIDSARVALRLGARKVTIQYRRSEEEMPAFPEEIQAATKEGIRFHYLAAPVELQGEHETVKKAKCIRMQLGEPDDSGRRKPVPIPNSEFVVRADVVIMAIGLEPTTDYFADELKLTKHKTVWVNSETMETSKKGVFAGGDIVMGPSTIVESVGQGIRAAHYIDLYLKGEKPEDEPFDRRVPHIQKQKVLERKWHTPLPPLPRKEIPLKNRKQSFEEVEVTITEEELLRDASRCLKCSICSECHLCETVCEAKAIDYSIPDQLLTLHVGTIIVTTGFKIFDARKIVKYGYGKYPNIYTSLEIERLVNASGPTGGEIRLKNGEKPKVIGIVHCVGSRDVHYNSYCSKVCCMYSLKLAHLLKERTGAEIYNFYIDMRTPGKGYEEFYQKILQEGVHFVRGRVAEITDWPIIGEEEGKLVIRVEDTLIGAVRRIPVDMVVLSVGLEPSREAERIRKLLNLSCSHEGFFLERHPKLAPVSTFSDGIFIAGACQGPKDIPETVAQAGAAAAEVLAMIDKGELELEPNTAFVNEEICSFCQICIGLCPFSAIEPDYEKKVVKINEILCKGCGTCAAACPVGAIDQNLFSNKQILSELRGILHEI